MNVDLMRKIDFYLGVPLCFLFSFIDRLLLIFTPNQLNGPKKAVFIELSEMGSAILADPCMRQLKSKNVEIFFLIFKKNKASLNLLKTVPENNIFVLRESSIPLLLWDSLRFFFWCRKNQINTCIDLELFSRVTSLLTFLTRADYRVGFHRFHQEGLYRGQFLTHPIPYNHQTHIAHNFMNLIEALFVPLSSDGIFKRQTLAEDLIISQAHIAEATTAEIKKQIQVLDPNWNNDPIILVNANAGDFLPQRKWPIENFAELILMLLKENLSLRVLLTGSPSEKADLDRLHALVSHPRCINFAGAVRFEELPALYTLSKILITNDSGPAHFSSVTKIKSFVFFGPETPQLYGSLGQSTALYSNYSCSPCVSATNHRKTNCTNNMCIKVITPQVVFTQVQAAFTSN
ncbi:MAG: glycosyltransferase family 9 protein [Bdellovibrio sp.]|nr:glycosyltransferase family 9 protein [Bdellovibrio sp.]